MVFVNGRKVNFRPKSKKPARKKQARRPRARRSRALVLAKIQGNSGLTTSSSTSLTGKSHKLGKGLTAMGVPCIFLANKSLNCKSSDGQQETYTIGQWNSMADIFSMSRMVPQTDSSGTVPPFNVNTPTRFYVRSLTAIMDFNNTSSGGAVLDIYDIVPKRDIPSSSATGNTFYNVGLPSTAWISGLANQVGGVPVNVVNSVNAPGCVPTDSELFNKFYQIKSHKTVLLPQNAQHQHKVTLNVGRHFDLNEIRTDFAVFSGLKSFSAFTMVVIKGQVGTTSLESLAPTYAPSRVNVCVTERTKYQWVQANGAVWTNNYNLPSSGTTNIINLNQPTTGAIVCLPP